MDAKTFYSSTLVKPLNDECFKISSYIMVGANSWEASLSVSSETNFGCVWMYFLHLGANRNYKVDRLNYDNNPVVPIVSETTSEYLKRKLQKHEDDLAREKTA